MATLLWLQGGARSGNTMTFRNAWEPSACDLVADFRKGHIQRHHLGLRIGETG